MKIFKSSILISLLYFLVLTLFCTKPDSDKTAKNWNGVVKDIEIILASEIPDSIKAQKIIILFDTNQISLSDYREFYEQSLEKDPLKNLDNLKGIEKLISEEMKIESRRQKKKGEQVDYRSGERENVKK